VVLDNLNTRTPASLYAAFPAPEARRLVRKLEFHHIPKHGSWLNVAECELAVLATQCLDRRLPAMGMTRSGQDGHFAWCVQILEREDVCPCCQAGCLRPTLTCTAACYRVTSSAESSAMSSMQLSRGRSPTYHRCVRRLRTVVRTRRLASPT